MKKVIFIGNRVNVLNILLEHKTTYSFEKIWVLEDSPLYEMMSMQNIDYQLFNEKKESRKMVLQYLKDSAFDILVSNGCPFKLPIREMKINNPGALLLNVHPTYLPHLKGKTPLNGVVLLQYQFIGATVHYMDEGIDSGNIISQEKVDLNNQIDLGLIYYMSFQLEGIAFRKALSILEENKFNFEGIKQEEGGSVFNRSFELFSPDFYVDGTELIVRKVNAVGITTQGVRYCFDNIEYVLFEAMAVDHPWLLEHFKNAEPGDTVLKYSNKLLVKTVDGLIKFTCRKYKS